MSWIETFLTHLEARLRLIIEGDAERDGFPRRQHRVLERELIRTMKVGVRHVSGTTAAPADCLLVPDEYTLILPSIEAQILSSHPSELNRLTRKLESVASQAGFSFLASPVLRVVADPQVVSMSIQVGFSDFGTDESCTYQLEDLEKIPVDRSREKLPNAFLIVNGLTTFLIDQPVINIGRDLSNHLRLDDPQISNKHAQLRFIQGRFVIFDLDSRGGTYINGVPVSSHALNPGDVIRLTRLPLVYGQEDGYMGSQTQELPTDPPPPEVL